jgi:hypothetical protein
MKTALRIGMASVLALATAAPAFAQQPQYQPDQYQRDQYQRDQQDYAQPAPQYQQTAPSEEAQEQYQRDLRDYQARKDAYDVRREAYDARRDNYEVSRADYQAARAEYDRRHSDWERARDDYDASYGYGAYARVYGQAPAWDETRWGPYGAPAATYYGRPTVSVAPAPVECRNDHSAATAGGILGALAGAALGSNVAARGHRGDGAVLGGIVGLGIGASVGNAHDHYRCDTQGPYYSYEDTIAYQEAPEYRTGRYDDYARMRCRLAPAPIDRDGQDVRYVRVCPDADGRYRITG